MSHARAAGDRARLVLTLFVAGSTPSSLRAIKNLKAACAARLRGDEVDLTIIDVYQQPDRARRATIVALPTLVRSAPRPERRLSGDLSNANDVLALLDGERTNDEAEQSGPARA